MQGCMTERCLKCLMPLDTTRNDPNYSALCNWCRVGFPNYQPKGERSLERLLEANRNKAGGADCLVGISGGKDSSYAALELKSTYGMQIEAFTYIHDGLTPLALENAKRVCQELGIQHHFIFLPGKEHLKSFKDYFRVWLERPGKVSAAMTCVACKHLHLLGTRLAALRKIPMVVWANCPLENPPFLALRPVACKGSSDFKRESIVKASGRLLNEISSPSFLTLGLLKHFKTSVLGCLSVTPSSKYLRMRYPSVKHVYFYEFCQWSPLTIVQKLRAQTGWIRPDIPDDWHSDCIFNIFKEYMFQRMMGISYTDAFLSNQIRHDLISRQEARAKLIESKKYYASKILQAMTAVGLESLRSKIDISCFDINHEM
jgi:glucosamine--fructose-6-phosphate aminotransferase (isomerizing)